MPYLAAIVSILKSMAWQAYPRPISQSGEREEPISPKMAAWLASQQPKGKRSRMLP